MMNFGLADSGRDKSDNLFRELGGGTIARAEDFACPNFCMAV
jgi:hypothetical protein